MVRIIDNTLSFASKAEAGADHALADMAMDIETLAKVKKAPVKSGRLQGTIVHRRVGRLSYLVPAATVYARFQEFGGTTQRRVKRYSKAGTGAHYLRDSGDTIKRNTMSYLKRYLGGVKV
jgi:hypothetical protein